MPAGAQTPESVTEAAVAAVASISTVPGIGAASRRLSQFRSPTVSDPGAIGSKHYAISVNVRRQRHVVRLSRDGLSRERQSTLAEA